MKQNLKFLLKDKLSKNELELMPSSFDVVGSILIFSDFPKELSKKEKIIWEGILRKFKNVKTILKKTKETIHKENNVLIKLDVEKVYFSARMSSERKRIADLIRPKERVLVMFSGTGIYPLVIAENSECKEAYGIEINPVAHKYALENIKKNRLENRIKLFFGDVTKIMPKLKKKFDRILMPLPKGGENFLRLA